MNKHRFGLCLVFGIWMAGSGWAFAGPPGPALSSRPMAPDFTLTTLSGKVITNESLAGKPTLLMFWAAWCGVCRREMPNVKALYEEKRGKGLQAVAVGFQDSKSNIADYVKDHADTFIFPVAYDAEDRVSTSFAIRATPTFFLLDKEGRIVLSHVGSGLLQNPDLWKFLETL